MKIRFLFIILPLIFIQQTYSQTKRIAQPFKNNYFVEEKGQFKEYLNHIDITIPEKIICGVENNEFNAYLTSSGIYFILPERIQLNHADTRQSENEHEEEEDNGKEYHYKNSTAIYHKIAFKWNSNKLPEDFEFQDVLSSYSNYQALNNENTNKFNFAKNFKTLVIKNIFDNVDIQFSIPDSGGIKYNLIVHHSALQNHFDFYWEGINELKQQAGKLLIRTNIPKSYTSDDTWYFTDREAMAYTSNSNEKVIVEQEITPTAISFKIPQKTKYQEDIIIDPYIVNPNFPNLNRAYDIQEDGAGNIIVYGNYSQNPSIRYQIQKYDALGNLLWTYQTYSIFLGDIAADNAGNVYIIGGYCTGYRQKIDPNGIQIWAQTGLCEEWRLSFDLSKSILTIGGNFLTSNIGNLDTQTGNLANTILYNEETRAITTDCDGTVYSLTLPWNGGTQLRKIVNYTLANTVPAGLNLLYSGTGYAYNPDYSPSVFQGVNGIHVYGNYVYIYNGQEARVFDKATLSFLGSTMPPNGSFMLCSGISNDYCNNIYIGTTTGIVIYDSLLNQVGTISTPGAVYDIILSQTGDIIASGDGFWGVFTSNCGIPQPFVVTTTYDSCAPGSIAVNATGGIPPYSYLWSTGATSSGITNLIADTFSVYVHDKFCNEYRDTFYVHPKPVADFTANNVCEYSPMIFNDQSNVNAPDNITAWQWNFDDGNSSTLPSPSHQYSGFGTYNVSLITTTNNNCSDTVTKTVIVHNAPQANFMLSNVCSYTPAIFTDNSSIQYGNISLWQWDFGDGNSASTQNTSHLYGVGNYGTFPVKLVVTSDSGCVDSITQNIVIHPKPTANFTFTDDCVNQPANFVDVSTVPTGTINTWNWDFGDGNSATTQNPSHLYAADGQYIVTLIATSDSGCTDTVAVTITRFPIPTALFTTQDICVYDSATFADASTVNPPDNIATWVWNFGDASPNVSTQNPAHLYNAFGSYNVNLSVISNNGCVDDTTLTINVHPQPAANFAADTPCVNTPPTSFTDLSTVSFGDVVNTWVWNFNNNQGSSTLQNPTFNFGADGSFSVTLAVMSDFGCWDTITKNANVFEKPSADFSVDTNAFCHPYCVNFYDNSSSASTSISNWIWTFGNGVTLSGSDTVNTCFDNLSNTQVARYSPELVVKNSFGCFDTLIKTDFITVWPLPLADFEALPLVSDIYQPEIIFNNLSIADSQKVWHFGDGMIDSINYSPQHVYADSGKYYVLLEVWNQYACYDSIIKTIEIKPDYAIFIPNAFTPNNLGGNETFFFKGYGILEEDFEFYIFNRWGELIYYTQKFKPWDGTYKGLPAPQGVYVYKLICKDLNSLMHTYTGSVTLLR